MNYSGRMKRVKSPGLDPKDARADPSVRAAGLHLKFHNAPLRLVLTYIHDAAGLPIEVEPNVEVERPIELWNDQPVTREEAIRLLEQALDRQGYVAINRHGRLAIIPRQDAKKHWIPLPEAVGRAFAG